MSTTSADAQRTRQRLVFSVGLVAILAVVTRLPFFIQYVINWDESTYILLAQAILDGPDLYTGPWDSKPPVGLSIFAAFIAWFGKHIYAIRALGLVCVIISGLQLFRIGELIADQRVGLLAAVLFIAAMTAISSGQATMLELVALPFLLGATILLLAPRSSFLRMFACGALVGAAAMTRTNLAVAAPLLGVWIVAQTWLKGRVAAWKAVSGYASGGIAILVACFLPYVMTGNGELLWYTLFGAPAGKSANMIFNLSAWLVPVRYALGIRGGLNLNNVELWLACLVWIPAAIMAAYSLVARRSRIVADMPGMRFLLFFGLVVFVTIGMTGEPWAHHLIQVLPYAALVAAIAYIRLIDAGFRLSIVALLVALCLLTTQNVFLEYRRVGAHGLAGLRPTGPVAELTQFLSPRCGADCSLFLLTDHLAYWTLGKSIPTRVTHPSNLARLHIYSPPVIVDDSPSKELRAIFSRKPTYVVTTREIRWLKDSDMLNELNGQLRRDYEVVHEYSDRLVFQRLSRSRDCDVLDADDSAEASVPCSGVPYPPIRGATEREAPVTQISHYQGVDNR